MAKYRSNQGKTSGSRTSASEKPTITDIKEEKKFFQIAIIVTLAIIGLIWYALS